MIFTQNEFNLQHTAQILGDMTSVGFFFKLFEDYPQMTWKKNTAIEA